LSTVDDATRREAALQRMSTTASTDEGYRAQLVSLADSHGGIYREALEALYAHERETLGEEQARARVEHDRQLHTEMREHDRAHRRERLVALAVRRKAAYEQRALRPGGLNDQFGVVRPSRADR
jgi:hypothetical protein